MQLESEHDALLRKISNSEILGNLKIDPTFKAALSNYQFVMSKDVDRDPRLNDPDNREYVVLTISKKAVELARKKKSESLDANAFFGSTLAVYEENPAKTVSNIKKVAICAYDPPRGCRLAASIILDLRGEQKPAVEILDQYAQSNP